MLKIYGVPISVHTRKVIVAAIEKGIPHTNEPVIPFNPPAGWSDLSPTGKIPVLEHDGLTLRDSSVICTYLERTQPEPALYPQQTRELVQALWLEEYADGTVFREVVHELFFQKVIRPNILGESTDAAVVARTENDAVPKVFGYLEQAIGGVFLVADRLSVADIAVVSNLINYHYLGYVIDRSEYPRLASYFERALRHGSIAAALRAEQPFAHSMGLNAGFATSLTRAA
jgi:glutathione S-transferase